MEIKKVNEYYIIKNEDGEYYFCNKSKEKKNPQWKLFWYISANKEDQIEITGNIDINGKYVSIIVSQGRYNRNFEVNTSHRSEVRYDAIELRNTDERIFPEKDYISVPRFGNKKIKISDYFKKDHEFKTFGGEVYNGPLSSNQYITDFIKANQKLGLLIQEMTKRKRERKTVDDAMNKIEEFEKSKKRIDSIFLSAKKTFINLIKAIDTNDETETNELTTELKNYLKEAITLNKNNTNTLLLGNYHYLMDVINNYLEAARVVIDAENNEFNNLFFYINDETWGFVYHRAFTKKIDGPLTFQGEHGLTEKRYDERKKELDINNMIKQLLILTTKKMTNTDDLPDYYDIYKITKDVKPSSIIDNNDIGKIMRTCENISSENIELTNKYFSTYMDDKKYNILLSMFPLKIIISCSDGRKLTISRNLSSREESNCDEFGSYDVCITNIDLYFHIDPKKCLMCRVTDEKEYSYNYNYAEILKKAQWLELPNNRTISWKYLELHKEKLFNKNELNTICNELISFVNGLTSKDPRERINTLKKVLNNG